MGGEYKRLAGWKKTKAYFYKCLMFSPLDAPRRRNCGGGGMCAINHLVANKKFCLFALDLPMACAFFQRVPRRRGEPSPLPPGLCAPPGRLRARLEAPLRFRVPGYWPGRAGPSPCAPVLQGCGARTGQGRPPRSLPGSCPAPRGPRHRRVNSDGEPSWGGGRVASGAVAASGAPWETTATMHGGRGGLQDTSAGASGPPSPPWWAAFRG